MRPYILAETNYKTTRDQQYDLAILPWGATEAHNYHLPYSADTIEADRISAESARVAWEKGAKVIVLPTIPFGVNTGQYDIKLDINMYPSTQMIVLKDIIEVLNRQGINKLVVLNCHGGNDFRQILRELGVRFPDMFLCQVNFYQVLDRKDYFDEDGDHADDTDHGDRHHQLDNGEPGTLPHGRFLPDRSTTTGDRGSAPIAGDAAHDCLTFMIGTNPENQRPN